MPSSSRSPCSRPSKIPDQGLTRSPCCRPRSPWSSRDQEGTPSRFSRAVLSIAESGTGTDVVALIDAILSMQDSGAGADTVALIAQLVLAEVGSGADAKSVQEFLDIIDKTLA